MNLGNYIMKFFVLLLLLIKINILCLSQSLTTNTFIISIKNIDSIYFANQKSLICVQLDNEGIDYIRKNISQNHHRFTIENCDFEVLIISYYSSLGPYIHPLAHIEDAPEQFWKRGLITIMLPRKLNIQKKRYYNYQIKKIKRHLKHN